MRTHRPLIAKFYRAADRSEPVRDYIKGLESAHRTSIDEKIALLNLLDEENPHLGYPYSSSIDGEMRELRCFHGRIHYRILYQRSERFVVLLHIFKKRVRLVPESDIRIARARWSDFVSRMNAVPRVGRRPLGKDAP